MAAGVTDVINSFSELSAELIPKAYLPTIYDLAFKRKRSWLANRIPRSSQGIEGLKVYLTFITQLPWSWRAMSEFGYTPTGSKLDAAEQSAQLSCNAAAAIVSLTSLVAMEQSRWPGMIEKQMMALNRTFPFYVRGLLWSSQGAKKALGKVASVAGLEVTLDNAGLWNTATANRCKLIESGMYLQAYRGTAKVGSPVRVTSVDKDAGTFTVDVDPGLADNDVFTFSDAIGLDVPYSDLMPGILDVIDNDNTFQGVDRSAAANADFRSVVTSATGKELNHETLTDFFHKVYDPEVAYTNWKVVRKYWLDNIAEQRRYTDGGVFKDGMDGVVVGQTRLVADDDVDEDKILVPDFSADGMRLADKGALENLFGKGWQQVPGRPFLTYEVVWWSLLLAGDTRYMGVMTDISLE